MSKPVELCESITKDLLNVVNKYWVEYEMDYTFDPIIATAVSDFAILYLLNLKERHPEEAYEESKEYFIERIKSNT